MPFDYLVHVADIGGIEYLRSGPLGDRKTKIYSRVKDGDDKKPDDIKLFNGDRFRYAMTAEQYLKMIGKE